MTPDPDNVQRLGFEAWADNLIVNAVEDMAGEPRLDLTYEGNDVMLVIRKHGDDHMLASVRAYVEGKGGWQYHDRTIKLKGGRP
jgi:hypothetical protein